MHPLRPEPILDHFHDPSFFHRDAVVAGVPVRPRTSRKVPRDMKWPAGAILLWLALQSVYACPETAAPEPFSVAAAALPPADSSLVGMPDDGVADARAILDDAETALKRVGMLPVAVAILGLLGVVGFIQLSFRRARRNRSAWRAEERRFAHRFALHEAVFESIPYPVFVKDEQGRYVAVNKAYEAMFDCRRRELIGRDAIQSGHLSATESCMVHALDMDVVKSGRAVRRETRLAADDARRDKDVLLWVHRLENVDGKVSGLVGTCVEITGLREAEMRARLLEQRLNSISLTLPGAFFQIRCWPDGARRFNYVAGDTRSLVGMTPTEIMERELDLFRRLHPEDQLETERKMAAALAEGSAIEQFEFRIAVNGAWRWLRTEGSQPRRLDDDSMEWTGYWVDTTDFRQQQQQLSEAMRRAEEAVSSKSTFLAMMSHEIRTPMVGVLGLMELLETRLAHTEHAQTLAVAHESGKSLLHILDGVIDYSRIESGRLQIEAAAFDLRAMAAGLIDLFATRATQKGIRVLLSLDPRLAKTHVGDATRIRQIVTNLLSNAVKFTNTGVVDLRVDLLRSANGGDQVRISVIDTGIGISPDQQARLFQPFGQAEASTTRRFGGAGLGLVISQNLAHMMGGHVALDSIPGIGTTARLELVLPVAEALLPIAAPREAPCCRDDTDRPTSPVRILVAEDKPVNRLVISEQLDQLGYRHTIVDDGQQAWDALHAADFDIVITDSLMPVVDGHELVRRIRACECARHAHIPILVMSANTTAEHVARYSAANVSGFISKPTTLQTLGQAISRCLQ